MDKVYDILKNTVWSIVVVVMMTISNCCRCTLSTMGRRH
jgi:hypothetical protein